jgi:hypothetical protein
MSVFYDHRPEKAVYIAGPMTGYKEFNFPAFFAAEDALRAEGWEYIFNPARFDQNNGFEWRGTTGKESLSEFNMSMRELLEHDLTWICRYATHIALLPGFEHSKGARTEFALAEALGLEVIFGV